MTDTFQKDLENFTQYVYTHVGMLNLSNAQEKNFISKEIQAWKNIRLNRERHSEKFSKKNLY